MATCNPIVRRRAALKGSVAFLASTVAAPAAATTAYALPASSTAHAFPVSSAAQARPVPAAVSKRFDTLYDLQRSSGLSGTVSTRGDEFANDGAGVTYKISTSLPSDPVLANVTMALADGRWAIPQRFATAPKTQVNSTAAEDAIKRGQTFVSAGKRLQWDGVRQTPLSGKIVHKIMSAPYPVSCASFIGMVLVGWDYSRTTYVANKNTVVGYRVDFRQNISTSKLWQANNLASWFYANGNLWLEKKTSYRRGDIMFFSNRRPTVTPGTASGARSTFGNVYHVAIFLGNGMLMHSTGVAAGQGVHVSKMGPSLQKDLSFVARPKWIK